MQESVSLGQPAATHLDAKKEDFGEMESATTVKYSGVHSDLAGYGPQELSEQDARHRDDWDAVQLLQEGDGDRRSGSSCHW